MGYGVGLGWDGRGGNAMRGDRAGWDGTWWDGAGFRWDGNGWGRMEMA